MSEQQEKKNKTVAMITTVGVHAFLLLIFMLMMAWRAPNPPSPEYGIEVNFGLDEQGGGDIQPETTPGQQQEEEQVEDNSQPEQEEQSQEQIVEQKESEQVVSKVESPVVVKEEKAETKKEVVKEKPVEKVIKETPKEDTKKQETKEVKPTEEKKVTDTKKGDNTTSQGDDAGKVGDKGNPEGKLDAKALYGKPGGGGGGNGFGLSMSGWAWADEPKIPELPDNEDGRIEFEIECDENGDIIGIQTIQRGLSAKAEQMLKEEIRKNSLVRTSSGQTPERSKGRVVFILKTK